MSTDIVANLPDLSGLQTLLARYRDQTAAVIPMTDQSGRPLGNNGDRLMHEVFRQALPALGITPSTGSNQSVDLVVVPPNGALMDSYGFKEILRDRLMAYRRTPVVIFPSSALFATWDPGQMFEGRSAESLWILREQRSFDHLDERWSSSLSARGVTLALDHDVVVSGHHLVREMFSPPRESAGRSRLLVAARTDREAGRSLFTATALASGQRSSRQTRAGLAKQVFDALPDNSVRTMLVRGGTRAKRQNASMRLLDAARDAGLPAELGRGKFTGIDASSPLYVTYTAYKRLIDKHDAVVTDRLHVALPAAISGREVYLVDSGYHKLSGVYERSLTTLPNITLLRPE